MPKIFNITEDFPSAKDADKISKNRKEFLREVGLKSIYDDCIDVAIRKGESKAVCGQFYINDDIREFLISRGYKISDLDESKGQYTVSWDND